MTSNARKFASPQKNTQQQYQAGSNGVKQGASAGSPNKKKLILKYNEIKQGDIVAICKEEGIAQSEVKGNTQIHQKTYCPHSSDGDFRIDCHEPMMFSNIIKGTYTETDPATGQPVQQITLKTFMEAYGNYRETNAETGEPTTDAVGDSYLESFGLIDESVAASLDAEPTHKKRLLGSLKLGNKLKATLEAPMMDCMLPFFKRATIDDVNSPNHGEEDMTKSPAAGFQLWLGKPKQPSVEHFHIPGTDLVLYTKVFDHTKGFLPNRKAISNWDHLMQFIYEKGDAKTSGKRPFRFLASCKLLPPSDYHNSQNTTGRLQYKIAELHIYQVDHPKARDIMSDEEIEEQRMRMIKSANRFVINAHQEEDVAMAANDDSQQQQQNDMMMLPPPVVYGPHPSADDASGDENNKRSFDDVDPDDYDSLIRQDESMRQQQKKKRTV